MASQTYVPWSDRYQQYGRWNLLLRTRSYIYPIASRSNFHITSIHTDYPLR